MDLSAGVSRASFEIETGEIHLWQASLAVPPAEVEACERILDANERGRADRFLRPLDRMRFVVARARLRLLLGRYLAIHPASVSLTATHNGKPSLTQFDSADLRFNVSHAHDLALYAIARGREVGVDIERVREDLPVMGIAEQFFAPEEIAALRALPPPARVQAFFVCWTRKEAYLKARGEGIGFGLDRFAVGIAGDARGTLSIGSPLDANTPWSIEGLNLPPGYVGAVVAAGTDWTLQRRT